MNIALKHHPTRRQAFVFFFFTLVLAIGLILWIFFINKGTLVVEGAVQFEINVGDRRKKCSSSPCIIELTPRKYSITLVKEGFYDNSQTVEIRFLKETKIQAHFRFIPVIREIDKKPELPSTKDSDETIFLETANEKHILKKGGRKGTESIVEFSRLFQNPRLLTSTDRKKILVVEALPGRPIFYLIDSQKKSRKRLEDIKAEGTEAKKFLGPYIFFEQLIEEKNAVSQRIFAINTDTFQSIEIPAIDIENIIETETGIVLFVSSQKQDHGKTKLGPSITEVIEEAKREIGKPIEKVTRLYITELDIGKGKYRTIVEVPVKEDEKIQNLSADPNGRKLYFEKSGKWFEVALEN